MISSALFRLVLTSLCAMLLLACSSGGESVETEPDKFFPTPLPGLPEQNYSLEQSYLGFVPPSESDDAQTPAPLQARDGALSLLSYNANLPLNTDSESALANPASVFTADEGLVLMLDTQLEQGASASSSAQADYAMMVRQDTVYAMNLDSGKLRALRHFSNSVCALLPVKTVQVSGPESGEQTYDLLDAMHIYVETSEGLCQGDDSEQAAATRRYYRLPVNYKADATDIERCSDEEGGRNDDTNTCYSTASQAVTEAQARAQIVFGWVPDDQVANAGYDKLTWGYLGYGFTEQRLRFYDADGRERWSQVRGLQAFVPIDLGQGQHSPKYLFELQALDNRANGSEHTGFAYLLQAGRDIFVFDSTQTLFELALADVDNVLTDRVYQLDEQIEEESQQAQLSALNMDFDDDELVLLDQHKVYRLNYATMRSTPNIAPGRSFTLRNLGNDYQAPDYRSHRPFSQFDLKACADEQDRVVRNACANAHDVADTQLPAPGPAWQFISDCERGLGCQIVRDNADYCVSPSDLAANPALAALNNPCGAADYRDLNELDLSANNAEFRGYMQYAKDYVRDLDFELYNNSMLITARMWERNVLLQYFYNESLSVPRSAREWVLLGAQFEHQDIQAQVLEGNLFIDLLRQSAVRNNECYKNDQRVRCELDDTTTKGDFKACTGKDLADGLCRNSFNEYKRYALFCSANELRTRQCREGSCTRPGGCDASLAPIDALLVDAQQAPQAKWLRLQQQDLVQAQPKMFLLASNDAMDDPFDSSDSYVKDEGVLGSPTLYGVDASSGSLINDGSAAIPVARIAGEVEAVLAASSSARGTLLELIKTEALAQGGSSLDNNISVLSQYVVADLSAANQAAPLVSELQFVRPSTRKAPALDEDEQTP